MSNTSEFTSLVCANCGKEGSDVTNTCNKCKSVMYCNAACKKKHRHKHKKECKRRAKELHDEKLFKQPPPDEDCPICFLRMPYLGTGRMYMTCCGKMICSGCIHAPVYDNQGNEVDNQKCPFCRTPPPISAEENFKRLEKRIELHDAQAIYNLGSYYDLGQRGLPQSYAKALKLYRRAGELGHADANCSIGYAYRDGRGVDVDDEKKATHYFELGAMGGRAYARHSLGCNEGNAGNVDRALKHLMIATKDGYPDSLKSIKRMYERGLATKDDYGKALRSYQAYLDEIKSDQRDKAAAFSDGNRYYESPF